MSNANRREMCISNCDINPLDTAYLKYRVLRGGSWLDDAADYDNLRNRGYGDRSYGVSFIGFRLTIS